MIKFIVFVSIVFSSQLLLAQAVIPACKSSNFQVDAYSHKKKETWSDQEVWLSQILDLSYQDSERDFEIQLRHDFKSQETKVLCLNHSSNSSQSIQKTWIVPVILEDQNKSVFWQLHLLVNPNGTIGYWFQPLSNFGQRWGQSNINKFYFYEVTKSLGVAQKYRESYSSKELIKIIFDKQ